MGPLLISPILTPGKNVFFSQYIPNEYVYKSLL